MRITLNGNDRPIEKDLTALALLGELRLQADAVVIELNGDIISKEDYAATVLADGDEVELIMIVGGG